MHNFPLVVGPALWLWIIAAVGVTAFLWHKENRPRAFFVGTLLLFSFLAVCPGFFFRQHYFIQMLPVVALLAGIAVNSATRRLIRAGHGLLLTAIPVLLFFTACDYSIDKQRTFLFDVDPLTACRSVYYQNPFPEAVQIANYIDSHAPKDAGIAVLGSEPEIFFYTKRHSVTGYIYTYGLLEQQKYALEMQKQMIDRDRVGASRVPGACSCSLLLVSQTQFTRVTSLLLLGQLLCEHPVRTGRCCGHHSARLHRVPLG